MHRIRRSKKTKDESYWLSLSGGNKFIEYSNSELQVASNDFHESFKFGEDEFSILYKGILPNTSTVAIKMLKERSRQEGKDLFNQEVEILSKVRHPNIVKLLGVCRETCAFIFEYLPNGSLEERLQCKNNTLPLSWQARVRIAFEICTTLSFLHSSEPHGIAHRDVNPYNILLDGNDTSKLFDFGISCELNDTNSAGILCHLTDIRKGTYGYIDPEYLLTNEITAQNDVYSFGILLLRLVTCKDPWGIRELVEAAQKKGTLEALIDASAGPWPFREAEKLMSLGLRCSDPMRENRPDLSTEVLTEIFSMLQECKTSFWPKNMIFRSESAGTYPDPDTDNSYYDQNMIRKRRSTGENNFIEYSYSTLQVATNDFHESFKLGEGWNDIVYKGVLPNSISVAIKLLKDGRKEGAKEFNQEVEILSNVWHPNIVKLLGVCRETCAFIMEYLPNGSLEERLQCKNNTLPLSWRARVRIAFEICTTLSFLHCSEPHGIVHGDLKPSNILLDGNDTSKLFGFGISCELNDTNSEDIPCHLTDIVMGTYGYIDPEYFCTNEITAQIDVYSFGILLLRLVTCKDPWDIRELVEAAQKKGTLEALIDASAGPWPFREAEKLMSLGLRCSDPMRENRPDLSTEVLKEIKSMLQEASEYSYADLHDATNNFNESFKLEEGGFGIVYKGILRNTTVAIKMLKEGSSQGAKEFNQEVEVLSQLRHQNLAEFIGACAEARALIYEYQQNGSLDDRLRCKNNTSPLSWQARVRIACEICSAISFLHCIKPHGIVHGNLKPDNILLDENNRSKICNFRLCCELNYTSAYMEPEYLSTGKTTPQCDVYSFGIILLRLVTCKDPLGLRDLVDEARKKGTLKALIDASAGPWPFREAGKMILLGLRCSDLIRKNRPDLSTEVLTEIKSMLQVANYCGDYSYSELQAATNNFHESFKLGEGGFGVVYKGILNNTTVAIKILKEGSNQGAKEFIQEIEILSEVRHPNLVKFIGACAETHALIYEYLPNGSLEDRMRCKNNTSPLSWQARVRIALEICSALSFLHCSKPHGIVHGDLKPDNVLLDANDTSKICDFGLCRELSYTPAYMEREYLSTGKTTPQCDVYSFGIILLRLVTCKDPLGLRDLVDEARKKGTLKALIDASAGPWPFREAEKMILLGLRCSDLIRKNRPDLSTEVLTEIKSMLQVANYCGDYSYSELQAATNNFHESFKLGEGGFGIVYKGILNNTTVAIKMLKEGSNQGAKEFIQEIEILSEVRHPNLVKFIGACAETRALIYEYLPNGSLEDRMRCKNNTSPLSWQARVHIALDICSALSFLHCSKPHGIVHGDLKPDNVLLDANDTSKICDFGLCRELNYTASASIPYHWTDCPKGTLAYMDLEYLSTGKLTPQFDVYSFGIILLRLATCKSPMGIRQSVEAAQKKGTLKALIDASAGKWPFKEAKRMISLGLRCSDPMRKNRPDLSTKVWKELKSMADVASASVSL